MHFTFVLYRLSLFFFSAPLVSNRLNVTLPYSIATLYSLDVLNCFDTYRFRCTVYTGTILHFKVLPQLLLLSTL